MVVPLEREEDATVVAIAPLMDAAMVATPGSGEKHRGGRLWQSGGVWFVL